MNLHFQSIGSGQPFIILHGLFGSSGNWRTIAKSLSEKYQVLTVDLRNHGKSPHDDLMDYQVMTNDLFEFISQQKLHNPIILGHSMGGKVAMQYVLQNPTDVAALIVVDIAPVTYQHGFEEILLGLKNLPVNELTSRKQADEILSESIKEFGLRQFFLQNLAQEQGQFFWRINISAIFQHMHFISGFPEQNSTFEGKTLFVRGANSDYVTDQHQQALNRYFPEAEIETVDNAGHWVHAEQSEMFLQVLNDNLN
jgi:esterase